MQTKISDQQLEDAQRLLNKAIHELVFAIHFAEEDNPGDANQCLMTAQGNIEQVNEMMAQLEEQNG